MEYTTQGMVDFKSRRIKYSDSINELATLHSSWWDESSMIDIKSESKEQNEAIQKNGKRFQFGCLCYS